MTENEKIIEEANEIAKGRMYATNEVIRLQKELEQYRAIGTVEEIENSFKKTINAFEKANPLIKSALDILQEYQSIGTIEDFKALKEKRTAKSRRIVAGKYFCPECGRTADMGYCKACGQNLY